MKEPLRKRETTVSRLPISETGLYAPTGVQSPRPPILTSFLEGPVSSLYSALRGRTRVGKGKDLYEAFP